MIKGLYTAASSMVATSRKLNIISNNLANSNTPAYKKDQGIQKSFSEMYLSRLEKGKEAVGIGEAGSSVALADTYTDLSSGKLKFTNNPLNLAIKGEGYFVIDTPMGRRYSRDGNFKLNEDGEIVNSQGYVLIGNNGVMQTISGEKIHFDSEGQLSLGEISADSIMIVDFENDNMLQKEGDNLFKLVDGGQELEADNYELMQGYLEESNVNIVNEMVNMIEVNRLYEANQRVIRSADETLDKAVNEIGRLR